MSTAIPWYATAQGKAHAADVKAEDERLSLAGSETYLLGMTPAWRTENLANLTASKNHHKNQNNYNNQQHRAFKLQRIRILW